jgi:hypothetical protein
MGMVLIYGLLFLLILLISAPIIYFIFKRIGKPKLGILFAFLIVLFVALMLFTNNLDEISYSKTDARKDLQLANLFLNDDFEIIKNEVTGMPERFQKTELKISEHDKIRIINEIKNGKSFKKLNESRALYIQTLNENSPRNKIVFTNYFYNNQYVRESYYREKDYVPILMEINLTEKSNILELNRIED